MVLISASNSKKNPKYLIIYPVAIPALFAFFIYCLFFGAVLANFRVCIRVAPRKADYHKAMNKSPFRKILIVLLPLIIVPLLGYTAWQIVQRSRQQALIQSIYQQQLESILLSINQNSWDRLSAWTSQLAAMVESGRLTERSRLEERLTAFIGRYAAVPAAAVYRGSQPLASAARSAADSIPPFTIDEAALQKVLSDSSRRIERMFALAAQNYIRPLAVAWQPAERTLLLTPLGSPPDTSSGVRIWAALLIDQRRYVEEVVAERMRATGRELFDFAVRNRQSGGLLYASVSLPAADFEQSAPLWILPDLELQIKLRGMTLTALADRQTRINLVFLAAVNLVLLLGVALLIRNMVREVQLARQKTDFVANVSHELRTPLALIRMYAETLELDRVSGEARKKQYYRTIMNESTRLTQLINNILDFSRIEAGQKVYHMQEEELAEIAASILELYRFHLEQKGFTLEEELAMDLPRIAADREAVGLALINLLDNAVKYSAGTKEIRVGLEQRGGELHLAVTDRGIGISEGEHRRIFEKFYRIESSLVRSTSGSGLGLALVEHIMAVHGGRVLVESRPGRGSTFTLVFPVKESA
jgi:two-component system phosphate regulon sensor histidine kinase PhoR